MQDLEPGGRVLMQEQWEMQGCSQEGRQGFADPLDEEDLDLAT